MVCSPHVKQFPTTSPRCSLDDRRRSAAGCSYARNGAAFLPVWPELVVFVTEKARSLHRIPVFGSPLPARINKPLVSHESARERRVGKFPTLKTRHLSPSVTKRIPQSQEMWRDCGFPPTNCATAQVRTRRTASRITENLDRQVAKVDILSHSWRAAVRPTDAR
jgi:hypothetical protein